MSGGVGIECCGGKRCELTVSEMFSGFLTNLQIDNATDISYRYGQVTSALNKEFRATDSTTANSLQVGSYGRWTGIKSISDLDMLYIMPDSLWDTYKNDQSKILEKTKNAITNRYPNTTVKVDRLVVQVIFTNFMVEVQPVFKQSDGSYKYPDTYDGGCWKITKPQAEIDTMKKVNEDKNGNLRRLCKMARAWKNKHGLGMGGLLIDTLAHNFLKSTDYYDDKSYHYYDWMVRDFFGYLKDLPEQDYYAALGSGQRVKVKKKFQKKAKKAHGLALVAIEAEKKESVNDKWKKIFGRPFPAKSSKATEALDKARAWDNTEQFIEDLYDVDIRYDIQLECKITQAGFMPEFLREMLAKKTPLRKDKNLLFWVKDHNISGDFLLKWKVLNRGDEAQRRNCIRGQIVKDEGKHQNKETTNFRGEHIVECYAIINNVVVAKDRIDVPIQT